MALWHILRAIYLVASIAWVAYASGGYKTGTYEIFGDVVKKDSMDNYDDLIERCFAGFGYRNCELIEAPKRGDEGGSDLVLQSGGVHTPFHADASIQKGEKFCLECCSQRQTKSAYTESWQFKCPIASEPTVQWDKFEHEFRFARRRTTVDIETIHCPLFREPEVQVIQTKSPNMISGYFQLELGDARDVGVRPRTQLIAFNASPGKRDEQTWHTWDGYGLQESMQSQLEWSFHDGLPHRLTKRDYGAVRVSRDGPDPTNGYTWSVTFANGSNEIWAQEMALLDNVKEPERTENYRNNRPWWQNEVYDVGLLRPLENFTNTSITITTRKLPRKKLHGFRLELDVLEHGRGLEFWREVVSCKVHAIEDYPEPVHFHESYIINARFAAADGRAGGRLSRVALLLSAAVAWALLHDLP